MIELIEKLNRAYGTSTPANNRFEKAIKSIHWDSIFEADGEIYFVKDFGDKDLTLTVENLNPFKEKYKPTVMFGIEMIDLGWI